MTPHDIDQQPNVTVFEFDSLYQPHKVLTPKQRIKVLAHARAQVEEELERAAAPVVRGGAMPADSDWAEPTPSAEAAYAGVLFRSHRHDRGENVFISYAHEDQAALAEVRSHLAPLIAHPEVRVWDDSYLATGADWNWTIRYAIDRSRAAILLVSKSFFSSTYIGSHESKMLLKRSADGKTKVFMLRLDDCEIPEELASIQTVNHDSPLTPTTAPAVKAEILTVLRRQVEQVMLTSS